MARNWIKLFSDGIWNSSYSSSWLPYGSNLYSKHGVCNFILAGTVCFCRQYSWNGDDKPSYVDCYVWCNSKRCSQSVVCLLSWRMDVIMHYFCVWKYARICHCTPILHEKPKKKSGVTWNEYANHVVSNLCWFQHNLLDNSPAKLTNETQWRQSIYILLFDW